MATLAGRLVAGCAVALSLVGQPLHAVPLADSIADFAGIQGGGGWSYGYYNRTANGAYATAGFSEFAIFDVPGNRWAASAAQVGGQNNVYLSIDVLGGHPNGIGPDDQDANIWAVRRYTSEVAGPVRVDFDLHKLNTSNTNAGGITGRIFVNGIERFTRYIANQDGIGVSGSLLLDVALGSLIDFAIDPTGVATDRDGAEAARADGSQFSAVIDVSAVPEPSSAALMLAGLGIAVGLGRRRS